MGSTTTAHPWAQLSKAMSEPMESGTPSDAAALFSAKLAQGVVKFFGSRKGFDHWWHHIDDDVQAELIEELADRLDMEIRQFISENAQVDLPPKEGGDSTNDVIGG